MYTSVQELPKGVRENLPAQAQKIYRSAYNSAHDEHKGEDDVEQTAHRIAWGAVKQKYEKDRHGWHRVDD